MKKPILKNVLAVLVCSLPFLVQPGMAQTTHAATAAAPLVSGLPDFTQLVEKASPAVVNIRTTERMRPQQQMNWPDADMQQFFQRFFGMPLPQAPQQQQPQQPRSKKGPQDQEVPKGIGSGFIISNDGYILTNTHVIDGADDVYVKLTDGREYKAKIIGSDKLTDVALLKIDGKNLPVLPLGNSDKIKAGQWVIAIGSPFDFDNTVTHGIISAKSRDTGEYLPLIQTDAPVNPGNSGGPLINMEGQVIGINSQIYSRSGGYMGISFAVPINYVMKIADQLKATGKVVRGRIGVQISAVTKEVAESLGLPRAEGAFVSRVEPKGPADVGHLQAGDIILKLNGAPITNWYDLPRQVGEIKPNTVISLTVWRRGKAIDLSVKVAELQPAKSGKPAEKKQPVSPENTLGLAVGDLTALQRSDNQVDHGVVVESVTGAAADLGLQPGDIILQVNNVDVESAKQFNALVSKLDSKRPVAVLVRRGDLTQFVPIRPQEK